jgi:hypothetical protein
MNLQRKIETLHAKSLLLFSFLWLFASPALIAAPNSQTVEAYKLVQTHFGMGPLEAFYTNDAVKLIFKNNGGLFFVARAPSWKVVIFRPAAHVAHEVTEKDFLHEGFKWMQFYGVPLRGYRRVALQNGRREKIIEYVGPSSGHAEKFTYWGLTPIDVKVPDEACQLAARAFHVPFMHDIPFKQVGNELGHEDLHSPSKVVWALTASTRRPGGTTGVCRLDTSKSTTVKLPKSEFDYPVGYKMVKTELEVLMTSGSSEFIEDLLASPVSAPKKEQKQ